MLSCCGLVRFAVCGCAGTSSVTCVAWVLRGMLRWLCMALVVWGRCCWVRGRVWEPSGGHQGCGQALVAVWSTGEPDAGVVAGSVQGCTRLNS
jgi:hypothetical protein